MLRLLTGLAKPHPRLAFHDDPCIVFTRLPGGAVAAGPGRLAARDSYIASQRAVSPDHEAAARNAHSSHRDC